MVVTHSTFPHSGKAETSIAVFFQNWENWCAGQRLISGFAVTRASSSSLTIASGTYMAITPLTLVYAGVTLSGVTACAASNHRYDNIYLDTSDGTVKRAVGTPAVPTSASDFLENLQPQPPDLPSETSILLYVICVDSNGIRSTDNENSVAGCADMRLTAPMGSLLLSYLSTPSQVIGDLIEYSGSAWARKANDLATKYLRSGGSGAINVWDLLNITSLYHASEARGCIPIKGASSWGVIQPGSQFKYIMSGGTGGDPTYELLKVSSFSDPSEAQGCFPMRGVTTWGVKTPGTSGQNLLCNGAGSDLTWDYDPKSVHFGAGSGTDVITTGVVDGQFVRAQANYTIVGYWLAETSKVPISTTTVCDILKKSSYQPIGTDSICASAKPTLTATTNVYSTTLTGWTTTITAGDILGFEVESNNLAKCLDLYLYVRRS